jgi:hypothetical protein
MPSYASLERKNDTTSIHNSIVGQYSYFALLLYAFKTIEAKVVLCSSLIRIDVMVLAQFLFP